MALQSIDFFSAIQSQGNTWLVFMLAMILNEKIGRKVTMANMSDFVHNLDIRGVKMKHFEDLPSARILRNESPTLQDHYPKTTYFVRDLRAILLSYYHRWFHANNVSH